MSGTDELVTGGDGTDVQGGPAKVGGRRRRSAKQSSWMAHVKATMRAHKGMKLKQVLKLAKKTYKKAKSMRGGDPYDITPASTNGGMDGGRRRRRAGGKTRRGGSDY